MQHRNDGIQRANNSRIVYAKAMWSLLIWIIISLQDSPKQSGKEKFLASATALNLFCLCVSHSSTSVTLKTSHFC